ncbi:hypothetical protein A2U01_0077695, partial [Trifolium medium]|nr:hypothetical protein [Trifolium medium]
MVPPAPNVDLYKPRKRKRTEKSTEVEEPKKKEMKKEKVDSSGKEKEKVKEIVAEKIEAVVTEEGKKKETKRKSSGIKIDERRSKMKHDK